MRRDRALASDTASRVACPGQRASDSDSLRNGSDTTRSTEEGRLRGYQDRARELGLDLDQITRTFLKKTRKRGDCRFFTRGKGKYGRVHLPGLGSTYAQRAAYELFTGPIPPGHEIHHTCGNSRCVEPAHLEALTPAMHASRPGRRRIRTRGRPSTTGVQKAEIRKRATARAIRWRNRSQEWDMGFLVGDLVDAALEAAGREASALGRDLDPEEFNRAVLIGVDHGYLVEFAGCLEDEWDATQVLDEVIEEMKKGGAKLGIVAIEDELTLAARRHRVRHAERVQALRDRVQISGCGPG